MKRRINPTPSQEWPCELIPASRGMSRATEINRKLECRGSQVTPVTMAKTAVRPKPSKAESSKNALARCVWCEPVSPLQRIRMSIAAIESTTTASSTNSRAWCRTAAHRLAP